MFWILWYVCIPNQLGYDVNYLLTILNNKKCFWLKSWKESIANGYNSFVFWNCNDNGDRRYCCLLEFDSWSCDCSPIRFIIVLNVFMPYTAFPCNLFKLHDHWCCIRPKSPISSFHYWISLPCSKFCINKIQWKTSLPFPNLGRYYLTIHFISNYLCSSGRI